METIVIVPKCLNNNTCSHVCNVKICKAMPFLCNDDQCSCHSLHQKCNSTLKWKGIRQSFSNKLKKPSTQIDGYFTQIDELYKSAIKEIEKSYSQIKNIFENFGLSKIEREVYQKLKEKKFSELTGESINKLQTELVQDKQQYQIRSIEIQKKQIQKQTASLIQMLQGLVKLNVNEKEKISKTLINQSQTLFKLDSKITQDVVTIANFFPNKKITGINLLYRASQNYYQTSKFWSKCDGKKHTITIIKTQFGNIIGGYTPFPWNRNKNQWQTDFNMQSFIFSLTNKHRLTLIKGQQQYAIKHTSNGPVFGGGVDLAISDKANMNTKSCANPGGSYNFNNEYVYKTQQSWKKFSGQSNESSGCFFKIQEWQVHFIVFG